MPKTLTLVLALRLGVGLGLGLGLAPVAGCKTDNAPPPGGSAGNDPAATSGAGPRTGRSGKIELPRRAAPHLPATDDLADDRGATVQSREERRTQRMALMDLDGNGEISDEERGAARAKREAEMTARLDTNKDGTVSPEERDTARHERAKEMSLRLDADGDGKVSTTELQGTPFRRFDTATTDTNGDGEVTVDELDAALKTRGDRSPLMGRRRGPGREPTPTE